MEVYEAENLTIQLTLSSNGGKTKSFYHQDNQYNISDNITRKKELL